MAAAKKPGKRGGSKPGRTRAAAALVVAARAERRPPPPPAEGEVHEGEFTEARARPAAEPPTSAERARDLLNKVRSRGGRPPELTHELIERIATSILNGSPPMLALKAEGFADCTYGDWRRKAKADLERDPPEMTLHVEFSAAVDLASASFGQESAEWMQRARDTKAGSNQPNVVQFLLKSHHKAIFAETRAVEVSGPEGGPVKVEAHTARETVFLEAASVLGPALTTAFLVEKKRWPSSVDEAQEWLAARQAAGTEGEPSTP